MTPSEPDYIMNAGIANLITFIDRGLIKKLIPESLNNAWVYYLTTNHQTYSCMKYIVEYLGDVSISDKESEKLKIFLQNVNLNANIVNGETLFDEKIIDAFSFAIKFA